MSQKPRKTIRLLQDALLVARGLLPCGCVVTSVDSRNDEVTISLERVTSPAVADALSEGAAQGIGVDLHLYPPEVVGGLHIRGKVVKASKQGFNLRAKPGQPVIAQVQALESQANTPQLLANPSGLEGLRRLFQSHSHRLLDRLLHDFVDTTEDNIQKALDDATDLREITRLKDMRFIVGSRRNQIFDDFAARFSANSAALTADTGEQAKGSELHVLQQQVFEDWLDLQNVASRLLAKHRDLLFALNQLLNQVFGRDLKDASNPLAPAALCACLQYSADRLGIAREHRHVLYQAFQSALEQAWAPAMQSLIADLTRAGLHSLRYDQLPPNWSARDEDTEKPEPPKPAGAGGSASDADGPEPAPAPEPASHTPDQSLFRLMGLENHSNLGGWEQSSPQFSAHLRPKREDLLEKLRSRQPAISDAIREMAELDAEFGASIDQPTLAKADLVDQLFAPLQARNGMSEPLRDKLEQLRLPVFEVLLDTPEFLNQEDHPAREIVNDLMRLCFAERASTKNLESTVTAIIDELIHSETLDADQLDRLNGKLKVLVERQDQSFVRNSERLAKTLEGKERLRVTRQQVQRRLNAILGGRNVPRVLLDLLETGWEQLMVLAVLREGPQSDQYAELFDVVGLLLSWLAPEAQTEELAFERELESGPILTFIDRELRNVGDIGRFRSIMADLTGQLQQQKSISTVYVETYGDTSEPAPGPEVDAGDRWTTRARELAVGDWVEITLDDDEKRKLRLVWGGEEVLRFVFLSPTGMSEISFEFPEFVQKLRTGEASLVDDGDIPFVDQSLFNMVQDVYRRLNFEATHDALTGCMHRRDFEKLVTAMLAQSDDGGATGALVVVDIDEFSVINTTYGANAGDQLLQATGELVTRHCRRLHPEPHAGRISGNEFAILISNPAIEDSLDFAENLRQDFEKQAFAHANAEFRATLSASVCPITPAALSAGDLLNSASLSLKSAKRRGGNLVELVSESTNTAKPETPQWVSEIDRSIRDGSLFLRAQPIVAIDGPANAGKSYELLLGLTDASGKQVSPQAYIEAAEQFRRSTRVDAWVVEQTLTWMQTHPEVLAGIDTLNVNLSGASLSDDGFMLELETLLKANRQHASKICFEVTETCAVSNLHYAADFMREMKRLNCRFALDDFGTGLSSYAYLQKLPVDYVKIDGIFVRDMATNLTNYAMVRSINELCHFLDLKTIAEYVEDMEILETLREIQVDYAQGFGIAKPRRLDSLTRDITASAGATL